MSPFPCFLMETVCPLAILLKYVSPHSNKFSGARLYAIKGSHHSVFRHYESAASQRGSISIACNQIHRKVIKLPTSRHVHVVTKLPSSILIKMHIFSTVSMLRFNQIYLKTNKKKPPHICNATYDRGLLAGD